MQHTCKLQSQQKRLIKVSSTANLKRPDVNETTVSAIVVLTETLKAGVCVRVCVCVCVCVCVRVQYMIVQLRQLQNFGMILIKQL